MKKSILSLSAAFICFGAAEAYAVSFSDILPGELAAKLSESGFDDTSLTLSGIIDVRDLLSIAAMPNLAELDLVAVDIAAYTPDKPLDLPEAQFAADYMPQTVFFGKKLTKLVLPASLKEIGDYAFADNSFASVTLPESVVAIGNFAFYDCDELTSIQLSASLQEIGEYSFAECGSLAVADLSNTSFDEVPACCFLSDAALAEVTFSANIKTISDNAFAGCKALKTISLPNIESIGTNAFASTGIEALQMPESVEQIGDFAFACNDKLSTVKINSAPEIGEGLFFSNAALANIETKEALTQIPNYTFTGNKSIDYASTEAFENVRLVGDYALMDCSAEKLVLGSGLVYLGDGAMEGFTGLKDIDATALGENLPELGEDVFYGIEQEKVILTVAEDSKTPWKNAEQWKEFRIEELTGIDAVADTNSGIKAWFEGNNLMIQAPSVIEKAELYVVDGKKVYICNSADSSLQIDTAGFSERIYILSVKTVDTKAIFKLIR